MGQQVRLIASSMCTAFSIAALALFVILSPAVSRTARAQSSGSYCQCSCGGSCGSSAPITTASGILNCSGTCPPNCGYFSGNCDPSCGCNPFIAGTYIDSKGEEQWLWACECK